MSSELLLDRISGFVEEIAEEKQAADKRAMDDPGGAEGASSHPSTKGDANELSQPAPEGEQSADNTKAVKAQTPGIVDKKPEVTPEGAPKQDEVQQGQGVDKAKPTGEDPGTERDLKKNKEDPASEGAKDMGGTSHPASGKHDDPGEKWSADQLAGMDDATLFKEAADLGNLVAADIFHGYHGAAAKAAMITKTHCPDCHKDYEGEKCGCGYVMKTAAYATTPEDRAAAAGYNAAQAAGYEKSASAVAAETLETLVKHGHHRADLVASRLQAASAELQKQAMEGEEEDPTGGAAEGEDHGSEGGDPMGGGSEGGEAELLAAMGGGGGGGDPMGGGMPPEAGGMPPEAGGGMGGPPAEMGGMGEDEAVQQLFMALVELGWQPPEMGAMGPEGAKMAAAVKSAQAAGKVRFEEAKTAGERKVRDYMKGYLREMRARNK